MTANVVLNEMYLWKAVLFSEADTQRCPLRFLVQEICIPLHPGIKKNCDINNPIPVEHPE